jgi:hypothetical protein
MKIMLEVIDEHHDYEVPNEVARTVGQALVPDEFSGKGVLETHDFHFCTYT